MPMKPAPRYEHHTGATLVPSFGIDPVAMKLLTARTLRDIPATPRRLALLQYVADGLLKGHDMGSFIAWSGIGLFPQVSERETEALVDAGWAVVDIDADPRVRRGNWSSTTTKAATTTRSDTAASLL